ncbi:hypothetical protein L288_18955 [Sphingobium quisquiliarum P25]|uniref:TonB-denpendent receptor n=1 Tax=Sphingobium quisquiliarum P25 TaxID=1329909 RepID=T0GGH7_9SPHN|nr:TonB-dependent siderophore receptor [Sphingobium quisquiliarum]EQA99766.1 hypothetical protein L288_18955 [Sphingobium quisquiliarum P25]
MKLRQFGFCLLASVSGPALAQEAGAGDGSRGNEIIVIATGQSSAVSASKAETPIIESPQTISIVNREEMDIRAVSTVSDALAYTAGVNVESSGIDSRTDEITVRGFGAGGFSSNSNFVDGLRLPNGGQWTRTQFDPFGMEQVEVLKGPSSVLYGQTAPGGIINIVTKRPTQDFHGEAMLQAAGFTDLGRWQFQGAADLGGPLNASGTLSARLVGLVRDGQTQINKTSNSRYYVSPSLTWAPNDDVSWTLLGQYQRDDGGSTYQFLPMTGTLLPSNGGRIALDEYLGEPEWNAYDRDQILVGSFFRAKLNDNISFRNSVRYTHLKSLYRVTVLSGDTLDASTPGAATCARMVASYPAAYAGCIPGQTIGRRAVQGAGESDGIAIDTSLQAKFSTGAIEHTLMAGVDYFYTDWEHYRDLVVLPGLPRGQVEPLLDFYNPVPRGASHYAANLTPQIYTEVESDQLGLYLQDQIRIGGLRVTIGGRQDWARDDQTNTITGQLFTTKSDAFTWQAGAVYLFDNGLAPYLSYSESFQPQVSDPTSNVDGLPFVPTTGQQYEGGIRFEPRGTHAYFTLGGYQITQQNVVTPDPLGRLCGTSVCNVQTGEVRVRGLEFEARAATDIGLTAVGSITRAWSKVTKSNTPAELGNRLTVTPEWLGSAFLDYRLPEGALHGLGIGGGVRYTGKSWGDLANRIELPGRTLFDLFVRYDFGKSTPSLDGLSLSINARNLTDKTYVATCSGTSSCFYGSGRTVTARIQYRW